MHYLHASSVNSIWIPDVHLARSASGYIVAWKRTDSSVQAAAGWCDIIQIHHNTSMEKHFRLEC